MRRWPGRGARCDAHGRRPDRALRFAHAGGFRCRGRDRRDCENACRGDEGLLVFVHRGQPSRSRRPPRAWRAEKQPRRPFGHGTDALFHGRRIPTRLQNAWLRWVKGFHADHDGLLLSVSDHRGPMVPPDVRTLADFVKWCLANPQRATYGTAAAGSMLHFTGVRLAKAGGFEFVHLPYGGPNGIQDLLGGRIAATIYPIGTALPHVQSGGIRALATTGPQRSPSLPEVPTVREAGYPGLEAEERVGVCRA